METSVAGEAPPFRRRAHRVLGIRQRVITYRGSLQRNQADSRRNRSWEDNSMRTPKVVVSKIRVAALAASFGLLAIGGCSSQSTDQAPAQPIAANFALEKCEMIQPNLFKCPAVDQPLCTPEFTRTDISCVHIGPKGSVFIQRGGLTQ